MIHINREYLQKEYKITTLLIFDFYAREEQKALSDLEQMSEKKVNLLYTNELYKRDAKLAFNVANSHKVVFCEEEEYVSFKANALQYYFDIEPMYELMELSDKFQNLEENIKLLKEIKSSVSLEKLQSSKRYEWEIRYGLLESIQIIIDISCKVSLSYNLGNPKNYRECVELLHKHKYLQAATMKKVVGMIGLRNLLVQEYVSIDTKKLHQFLDSLDDFLSFAHELQKELA